MADYEMSIPVVLKFEGGLSDDPEDRGGLTKYGVCIEFAKDTGDLQLFDKDGDEKITREDIKKLSIDDAKAAFKKYFWDKFWLDRIDSNKKALMIFDSGVNHGIRGATALLQKALNKLDYNLVVDGVYGTKTFTAFQNAKESKLIPIFLELREKLYYNIVKNNPSQKVFLRGWLNRINGLKKVLESWD